MQRLLVLALLAASNVFATPLTPKSSPYDVVVPMLTADPSTSVSGQLYFDTTAGAFKGIDNSGAVRTFNTSAPQWLTSGSDLYYTAGVVAIGSTPPAATTSLTITTASDNANGLLIRSGTTGTKGAVVFKPENTTGTLDIQGTNSAIDQINDLAIQAEGGNLILAASSNQTHIRSAVRMSMFGAGTCIFDSAGNVSSSSDERLKTDIKPFQSGLATLAKINPIRYHWNNISGMETKNEYVGFSAQNVQSALPEGVGMSQKGYLSLQERAIIATLVNSVKELQAEVNQLKAEKAE